MSNLTHLFFCNQCWHNLCADLRCLFTILSSGRTFLFFLFYDSNHILHTCEMILLHVRFNSIYDVHGYCRILFTILSSGRTFLFFLFYDSNHILHTCEMILLHVRFNSIYDVHGYCRIVEIGCSNRYRACSD